MTEPYRHQVPLDEVVCDEGTEPKLQRYPLTWPSGWQRAKRRERAAFLTVKERSGANGSTYRSRDRVSTAAGLDRVRKELQRLGISEHSLLISTNVPTRLDGMPYSQAAEPRDPGVAVYFKMQGRPRVLAVDKWDRVADNLAAIAKHLEAMRGQARWGVGSLDQAFTGYTLLPANTAHQWRHVFGFTEHEAVGVAEVEARFRQLARVAHPEAGGSDIAFARLSEAKTYALTELRGHGMERYDG